MPAIHLWQRRTQALLFFEGGGKIELEEKQYEPSGSSPATDPQAIRLFLLEQMQIQDTSVAEHPWAFKWQTVFDRSNFPPLFHRNAAPRLLFSTAHLEICCLSACRGPGRKF